jgi:hypothetical protein
MMNPQSFSIIGYLSVLLWLAVPLLWLLRGRLRTPGWLPLVLAVVSLAFATINSRTHVARIEAAPAAESANPLDADAKRKALEQARKGDVADIRFAEDGADDFIDKAGMEDADRKYLESLDETAEPEWKKQKKQRGSTDQEEAGLDETLGGEEVISGVPADSLPPEEDERAAIILPEPDIAAAHRLDGLNLAASRVAILLGVVMLFVDYLTRANRYTRAFFPLPFPAAWRNAFTPLPAIVKLPEKPRRTLKEELAHITRRGDAFLCVTKDPAALPDNLPTLGKSGLPIDLLRADGDRITDTFVFESLWYRRSCFVVDSPQRAQTLFAEILKQLELRHASRAQAKHNVHLVWNLDELPGEKDLTTFERLASSTGFSLFHRHDP